MTVSTIKKTVKQDSRPSYRMIREKIRAYPHLKRRIYLQLLLHLRMNGQQNLALAYFNDDT